MAGSARTSVKALGSILKRLEGKGFSIVGRGERWGMVCGDGVSVLRALGDQEVDAVITDPPYGNGTAYRSYEDTGENLMELVERFMPEARRAAKRVLVLCGVWNIHRYPAPSWILCWAIPAGTGRGPWGFSCWQPILAYGSDPKLAAGKGSHPDLIVGSFHDDIPSLHPCPKPIQLMNWLVLRATMPGELIVDPFAGSGTTGIAALSQGRVFLGVEMDPVYAEEASRRLVSRRTTRFLFSDLVGDDVAPQKEEVYNQETEPSRNSATEEKEV